MTRSYRVKRLPLRNEGLADSFVMRTDDYNKILNTINFLSTELGVVHTHDITPDNPQRVFIEVHPEIFEEVCK